jgi:glycosyltransferase involved in cell wall biosynthesis
VVFRAFAVSFEPGQAELHVIGSQVFGGEAHADSLHRLADDLGIAADVVWRGFQEDVAAELARLDVLVHASTTPEPFGSVIVEGMAAGLPVVATAAGGPLEIVEPEQSGLLVPPGDVAALSHALRRLAADRSLRERLGARGLELSARYGPAGARTALLDVYSTVTRREYRDPAADHHPDTSARHGASGSSDE